MSTANPPISRSTQPPRENDSADPLQMSVQYLKGVGAARAELLAKLDLRTVGDLLLNLPREMLDLNRISTVPELRAGEMQTVRGKVVDRDSRQITKGRTLTALLLDCDGGYVRGVWFNQPWMFRKYEDGQLLLFSGQPKFRNGRWEIAHPQVQVLSEDDLDARGGMLPRYGLTEGLKMHEMRRIIRTAVELYADLVPESFPSQLRERLQLPDTPTAIRHLHLPTTMQDYEAARRRIIFDDLFEFQLGLAMRRRAWKRRDTAPALPTTAKIDARIRRLFPFRFTAGQDQAVREIAEDLATGEAMHRLLQADVGAGKTAVAVYAMLVAIAAGTQTVLMAPTEVLANQHWETVDRLLAHSRVERRLLTGSLTPAQRRQTLADIRGGHVQLVVGTQAVIQQDVEFQKLGLVVIDEQHKFGVMQRANFSASGQSPHVLVMTATPIPRSLCLTQFGDLDITTIAELPPGRQRVITSRITGSPPARRAWDFIKQKLREGRQLYVVCPRVEDTEGSDGTDLASAESVYRELSNGELREFRVGLVHGQMDRQQKAAAMDAFRSGETQVLVSTTVIEVGVDVPNATLMVIYQAERFGLSQLHQLRGRITRGRFQGYCFLFSEAEQPEALRRLSALEETSDGFRIAEVDFELRGPGDVLGTRQHGNLPLKIADLTRDQRILKEARETAFQLVESGEFDQPPYTPLKIRVLERFSQLMELPKSG